VVLLRFEPMAANVFSFLRFGLLMAGGFKIPYRIHDSVSDEKRRRVEIIVGPLLR
jgi:hypothetical protein